MLSCKNLARSVAPASAATDQQRIRQSADDRSGEHILVSSVPRPGVQDRAVPRTVFLFAMAFDPIFRWLQETIIPRNPDNLDFLQPTQCAYADDLAVAASSFRGLMTALAPAFRSVDHIAGLNLTYRKCCWVQHGTEGRESLWHWLLESCEEFRESNTGCIS